MGGWRVELDVDDAAADAVFGRDPIWNGYPLADLEPPFRQYTTVGIARRDGEAASLLVLRHPDFTACCVDGPPEGVAALLDADALPSATFVMALAGHLPLVSRTFDHTVHEMSRMHVTASTFRPPAQAVPLERLGPDDLGALRALYAHYPSNAFNADQLGFGAFFGVRAPDGTLLAAGGTHVVARRHRLAALGNVFTHPHARGRGYGAAVTGAVTQALLDDGIVNVILNVARDNEGARRIYERLGYREHCRYWEGYATVH